MKIIDRYIFIELIPPFVLSLVVLSFAVFTFEMMRFAKLFAGKGIALGSATLLILNLIPSFLAFTIPAACLVASITVYSRLAFDKELVAMWNSGLGPLQLHRSTLGFCFLAWVLTMMLAQWGHPLTNIDFRTLAKSHALDQLTLSFEPGVFNEPVKGMVFYVLDSQNEDPVRPILLSERRRGSDPFMLVARSYQISKHQELGAVSLRLLDGTLHRASPNLEDYRRLKFKTYARKVEFAKFIGQPKRIHQSREEILGKLDQSSWTDVDALRSLTQSYRELAFPISALLLGMLGVPIGILSQREKRASAIRGFGFGVVVFVLFYVLNILGEILVITTGLHPLAGAWFPELVLLAMIVMLFGFLRTSR